MWLDRVGQTCSMVHIRQENFSNFYKIKLPRCQCPSFERKAKIENEVSECININSCSNGGKEERMGRAQQQRILGSFYFIGSQNGMGWKRPLKPYSSNPPAVGRD